MRLVRRIVTPLFLLIAVYLGVLCHPQPLFAWSVSAQNLTLYSDRPFTPSAGVHVLGLVHDKLAASPLYRGEHHNIFICNAPWRRILLFNHNYRVAGVSYAWLTRNVFLRDALVEDTVCWTHEEGRWRRIGHSITSSPTR